MRYFGSKVSTLNSLYEIIKDRVPEGVFCDPFGGVGSVGSFFKSKGYNVWCGDVLTFAHYFQIARIKLSRPLYFRRLTKHLGLDNYNEIVRYINSESSKDGWFVREYSLNRNFFTIENAKRIQTCRRLIINWAQKGLLNFNERAVLLASLINSMDKVANTAGTYYAYLKKWHRKAIKSFSFEFISPTPSSSKGWCFNGPAKKLIKKRCYDIIYLDPPYNQRSYAHYYHLPETIALGTTPKTYGLSGIPKNRATISEYNSPVTVKSSFEKLLEDSNFKLLVFHYADNGILSPHSIRDILSNYGKIEEILIDSKGYTTTKISRNIKHRLYLVHNA